MTNLNKHKPYGVYERFIKRPQDFICALLAIIVLSPVLLVVAILVKIKLGNPILFTQERPGKDGKVFVGNKLITTYNSLCCKEMKVA